MIDEYELVFAIKFNLSLIKTDLLLSARVQFNRKFFLIVKGLCKRLRYRFVRVCRILKYFYSILAILTFISKITENLPVQYYI